MTFGILHGVSVGPGDPELITLKGLKILQSCPVVAFPAGLQGRSGIAEKIIHSYLNTEQITLPLQFPYVQTTEILEQAWQEAAAEVWLYLEKGWDVAFACEGDISFYSTFTYLAQTLKTNHPQLKVNYVAGVSSPFAGASTLGLPLTCQEEKLAILPALYCPEELEKTLDWAEVVVLMKVRLVYEQVWQILADRKLLNRAWVLEKISTTEEKIYHPLTNYPQLSLSYFSLVLIKQN
ncbi:MULTISPECIES: precorrin-2 C(20)-methyltransferase [unclassified Synechocystis]|uniref:precorrin-2 C(20)-methyltransferase n=1 Tax=unclassified Synechocystis TaxID=2640012 RepID=UPI0004108ED5|nr:MULTISPECIES: precorrin-2 C(20)-methyltransferase [unclassified Synechocystis]AIE75372.1 Cobalt-precorrin-2 C20-methyltransferase [Synechocystis sp. PCC 6714]MCT0253605.1 precorrin-2 C(20)-methyltransferase [Synechocystis sp. CS-94]